MSRDLLIEIGVEELPASFVARALEALPVIAAELFAHARLAHGAMRALGTPRRLALTIETVADRQADVSEEMMGPPRSVAFDAAGTPTKAGEAFAKKHGKGPDALSIVSTPKGEYVAVRREEKGDAAARVLPKILEDLCAKIPFQKSMRWGAGEVAFGRPIHWIVALFGEEIVPVRFAGVAAGRKTRGHRFLAPAELELRDATAYVGALREAHVWVDPAERLAQMRARLDDVARALGGDRIPDAFLEGECVSLVEEPHVVPGRFEERYLELPAPVIVSVMRHHQRYFALQARDTKALLPAYLNVVNTAQDPETIRRGNDRVLRARLEDARFFVSEDRKQPLAARRPKLDGIVFQAKLGTIGEKVRRIGAVAAEGTDLLTDVPRIQQAVDLAKCDLVTLIVGEFPELQGVMGRAYAIAEGVEPEVADAIRDHYLPKGAGDSVPTSRIAAILAVADRADTLAGCFGIGQVPTGSADPFALRRAALGIIRIALEGPFDVDLAQTIRRAHQAFADQQKKLKSADEVHKALDEFFRARLRAFYGERFRADLVEACLAAWDGRSIRDLDARVKAIETFRAMPQFESLSVAFKRTFNIAKDAPPGDVDAAQLVEPAEKTLAERFRALQPRLEADIGAGRYEDALKTVAEDLREPVDRFFETVFVMVDDPKIRDNRLRLLGAIAKTMTRVAHFHVIGST